MTLATAVRTGPLDDELAFTETCRRYGDMTRAWWWNRP